MINKTLASLRLDETISPSRRHSLVRMARHVESPKQRHCMKHDMLQVERKVQRDDRVDFLKPHGQFKAVRLADQPVFGESR